MNNKLMRLTWITRLLLLTLLIACASLARAGKHSYPEFMVTVSYETIEILKKNGMPVTHDREIPWLGISGIPGSYRVGLYQSGEIPQQAVLDIVKLYMDFYQQRGRKETFRLVMYRESKDEWRRSLFLGIGYFAGVKPYFELTLEGEKQ